MHWNQDTLNLIMNTVQTLKQEGMTYPTIRTTLYRLLGIDGWSKNLYNTMTSKLGEWRDKGLIPFGLFAEWGARERPYTESEIKEQIKRWQETRPYQLPDDGYLRALLVEHQNLILQIEDWCDDQALVVSSAGQLRRENLWAARKEWLKMQKELGAKGIIIFGLLDYDKGGKDIAGAHKRFFETVCGLPFITWGLTATQLKYLNLPLDEEHQIDGAFGMNPRWWREQIRSLLHIG